MNKLDEIALRVGMDLFGCERPADVKYARALLADPEILAELSKDEPVAYMHEICGATYYKKTPSDNPLVEETPLFTHPANTAEIEQRVAEAIAKWIEPQRNDIPATGIEFAAAIRREYL